MNLTSTIKIPALLVFIASISLSFVTANENAPVQGQTQVLAIDKSPQVENKHIIVKHPGSLQLVYHGLQPAKPPLPPLRKVSVGDKIFYVYPRVQKPSIQSMFLLENTIIKPGEEVLDIGSGSGVQAIFAAEKAKHVVATDLSHAAVINTKYNVKAHKLDKIIESRQGDLFGPVRKDEKFDVVIFNIDYPYDINSQGLWKVHERFFAEVSHYLKPGGRIYYQAGLVVNIPKINSMVVKNKLRVMKMSLYSSPEHKRDPLFMLIIPDPLEIEVPM